MTQLCNRPSTPAALADENCAVVFHGYQRLWLPCPIFFFSFPVSLLLCDDKQKKNRI
jgi:hypothetical protein